MKLGVEVKNGQQSSNPELLFDSTPLTPPTTLPPIYPLQYTNFANFGQIWMKLGVHGSKEWTAKLKSRIIFMIRPLYPPQPPYPSDPPQSIYFANFGPIWMNLSLEVKNGEQSLNLV